MNKVYELKVDSKNYSVFYEEYVNINEIFAYKYWTKEWSPINIENYEPIKVKLYKSDNGKKNFTMDIGLINGKLVIFSEKAINILKEILEKTGQIIPIKTDSKRKKFYGFYPSKNILNNSIVNLKISDWSQNEKGKLFYRIVLNEDIKNEIIFSISEVNLGIFVTDKFKEIVEKNDLKGFDFSREIQISD